MPSAIAVLHLLEYDLLGWLEDESYLPHSVAQLFHEARRSGNAANHDLCGDHRAALQTLKLCWQISLWLHRTLTDTAFKSGPFVPSVAGQRALLLAMATGTGKTKTCIALIYRLLKTQRLRRILFLVDRATLGEQAAHAFKDTRLESLQTFADTFGIKELKDARPETATAVHIATVQGMVK